MSDFDKVVYLKPGQTYRLSPSESITLRLDDDHSTRQRRMTGQEWYGKYREEWNKMCASGNVAADSHIEAAKKAAGIKE